ncbi:hypothetical protein [Rhodohalobacter sp. 8-1]|uniref:hypothetical protein n=1 Tax=Rhodohalobacter sp. 8-1 TaxID=3131972 RepID=UPI0030EEBDB0
MKIFKTFLLIIAFSTILGTFQYVSAQTQISEPDLIMEERVSTPLNRHYQSGLTFDFVVNNFGFGIGGQYRRVLAPQMEGVFNMRITGLRDASEQTFTDVFFGQQVVPNKYQRAFAFPAMIGLRKRLFADKVQDQYRFFVSASVGGVAAFSYPYFNDRNNNGYREQFNDNFEQVNDIFTGWSEGDWHFGGAGEFKIGVDVGRNFSKVTSIEFGYYMNYYPDGIQMMTPTQPDLREGVPPGESPFQEDPNNPGEILLEPYFDAQKFFGTPQITVTFGSLW